MASFKALCLAGVACLAATATVHAADLLPPPPQPIYAPPPAPSFGSGWYLRGDAGVAVSALDQESSLFKVYVPRPAFVEDQISTTALIGGGVGYNVNQYFRADVTGEYHFAADYNAIQSYGGCGSFTGTCYDGYKAQISSAVFLANGYLQLGTWYSATPYIGGGVGVANVWVNGLTDYDLGGNGGFGQASNSSKTNFAWSATAGVSFALTQNIAFDVNYRYLDMGTVTTNPIVCTAGCTYERQRYHLAEHDVRVGLRYTFADYIPAPPPPQMPLIRKY